MKYATNQKIRRKGEFTAKLWCVFSVADIADKSMGISLL